MTAPTTHPAWCAHDIDEGTWHASAPMTVTPMDGFELTVTMRLVAHKDHDPVPYVELVFTYATLDGTDVDQPVEMVTGLRQAEALAGELLTLTARGGA